MEYLAELLHSGRQKVGADWDSLYGFQFKIREYGQTQFIHEASGTVFNAWDILIIANLDDD